MSTINVNTNSMEHNQNDYSSGISIVIGFILSMSNHVYGWFGMIKLTANLDAWFQTIVIGFLGAKGEAPAPLRISEVNRILGKVDELADSEEVINVPYVVGETVKVTDGPFNSFSGIIEEVNEEKKKLKVMVKIFGRKNLLELSYMQVEKDV